MTTHRKEGPVKGKLYTWSTIMELEDLTEFPVEALQTLLESVNRLIYRVETGTVKYALTDLSVLRDRLPYFKEVRDRIKNHPNYRG